MIEFNGRNVRIANHGSITTWKETNNAEIEVYAAEGTGPDGKTHCGYGRTEQKAVVDLFREFEYARVYGEPTDEETGALDFKVPVEGFLAAPPLDGIEGAIEHIRQEFKKAADRSSETRDLPGSFWTELSTGQKIRAIRTLRQTTRLSLKSAKEIVDALLEGGYARA